MELRTGYKRTELGVIPEEWTICTLEGACVPSGLVRGPFGGALKKEMFVKDGKKIYEQRNAIYRNPTIGNYFINESKYRELKRFAVKPGEFIVSCSGTIGKIFKIPQDAQPGVINQALLKMEANSDVVDSDYFFYYFDWEEFQRRIVDNTHGGAMQNLVGMSVFGAVKLALPPRPEQRVIAAALSDVDALLAKLDALIAKKHDLKQAAMQQLLTGQTSLPGFSGEWEAKRLGEIGSTYGGLAGKTKADFGNGSSRYIPFLNVIGNVAIDPDDLDQVSVSASERQNEAKKGDLFFNGSSETPEEVGMCAVLLTDFQDVYLNSFCFGFRLREGLEVHGLFLAYFFRSGEGRKLLYSLAQGATRYNLSKSNFLKLEVLLPTIDEQTAIAAVLSDMDAEIAALEARRDKTRLLKQGMMQELLTGRIRLV